MDVDTEHDLAGLDFEHVTECIDPAHATEHDPFTTATWLVREKACPRTMGPLGSPRGGCPGATLLLCEDGYTAYRNGGTRHCATCGHAGPPSTWVEQATMIRSHPRFDTYLCPADRATFDAWQGTRPFNLTGWINHHRAHLETP